MLVYRRSLPHSMLGEEYPVERNRLVIEHLKTLDELKVDVVDSSGPT